MSVEVLACVVVAVLVALGALTAYLTAHRLDRLHIRTDLARVALVGVLGRRHVVAAEIERDLRGRDPEAADRLRAALRAARAHPPRAVLSADPSPEPRAIPVEADDPEAELAENLLGAEIARVERSALPAELVAELEDVEDRLGMARRFHNDAVRDTRALRERAVVRALRLAGRAPMPDYVELVDSPTETGPGVAERGSAEGGTRTGA